MKISNRPFLDLALDFSFAFWFIAENIFLHSIMAVFALALFMVLAVAKYVSINKIKIKIPLIFILYGIFVLVCYINILKGYSISPTLSKELGVTLLRNFAFIFLAYYYVTNSELNRMKTIFVYSTVIGCIFAMGMTFVLTGSLVLRSEEAIFNANTLAISAAIAICILVCDKKRHMTPYNVLLIAILASLCILSGTRKALIAAIITIAIYYILRTPEKLLKNAIIITFSVIVAYIALINIPVLYNTIGNRIESLFSLLMGESGDGSAESRADFIELGLKHFKNRPWIGHGINCFQILPGAFGTYSHSNYVELLFSVGIIGTLAYYSMYIMVLIKSINLYFKQRTDDIVLCIGIILSMFFIDIALVSYYERTNLIIVIICLALSKGNQKNDKKVCKIN